MGTKNKPGAFDCYANAHPDEPMFILLGRDRMAGSLVREWAERRRFVGEQPEKVREAEECAAAMDEWSKSLGKHPTTRSPSAGEISKVRDLVAGIVRLCEDGEAEWTPDEVAEDARKALALLGEP